jgi:hypothetical protein
VFELAEAAFDQMSLSIKMLVERIFECAGGVVGNDGDRPLGGDGLAQVIVAVGGSGRGVKRRRLVRVVTCGRCRERRYLDNFS